MMSPHAVRLPQTHRLQVVNKYGSSDHCGAVHANHIQDHGDARFHFSGQGCKVICVSVDEIGTHNLA